MKASWVPYKLYKKVYDNLIIIIKKILINTCFYIYVLNISQK